MCFRISFPYIFWCHTGIFLKLVLTSAYGSTVSRNAIKLNGNQGGAEVFNRGTIHHSSLLFSKLGPKAQTEIRTKGLQSQKARKCQDCAINNADFP